MDIENKYGTLETQKGLLQLLKIFDAFCSSNKIKYSMSGGSLLGAIRENGFIPWDDDLDIMLDRENYDLLLSTIKSCAQLNISLSQWIYRITLSNSDNSSFIPTLDVFVIDNVPNNLILKKIKIVLVKILQGMMKPKPKYEDYSWFYDVTLFVTYYLGKFFCLRTKKKWYDIVSMIGNKNSTRNVTCYNTLFKYLHLEYEANMMRDISRHCFEDTEVSVTSHYDQYLKKQYGNYMTPPKIEERTPQHLKN